MRNKISVFGVLAAAGIAVLFAGCIDLPQARSASVNYENKGQFGQLATVPVKDFVTVGLVFTSGRFDAGSSGEISGEIFTYQELLKEAEKKGADAIINVVIDKRFETVTSGAATAKREIWYGSALAIRYTNTLTKSETTTADGVTTSVTSPVLEGASSGGAAGGGAAGGGASASNDPPQEQNQGPRGLLGGLGRR